ncbi:hypothetical protein X736_30220 [Mesorhizobium sp. L2C089B000]|uniref:M13-type metalloendopeptidase n=2 Tax=Mesorhizobium TaxID=68287 RepID=UPI0003CFDB2A|nr:hypothetical protein X736_30220 [Mesorhizobium sp. L2C089B000]
MMIGPHFDRPMLECALNYIDAMSRCVPVPGVALAGQDAHVLDDLSGNQRFFLGFAQNWSGNYCAPVLQHALLTDPLAPAVQRTWIVRNFDAWYETFDVQPPMIYSSGGGPRERLVAERGTSLTQGGPRPPCHLAPRAVSTHTLFLSLDVCAPGL